MSSGLVGMKSHSTMPKTAMASKPAIRATALLIPEAAPARSAPTEFITTVVRGATVTAIPKPSTTNAPKKSFQYEPPTPGCVKSRNPAATIRGPMTSGFLGPYLATSPPDQRERKNIQRISGSAAAPALVAEYFWIWIRLSGNTKKKRGRAGLRSCSRLRPSRRIRSFGRLAGRRSRGCACGPARCPGAYALVRVRIGSSASPLKRTRRSRGRITSCATRAI